MDEAAFAQAMAAATGGGQARLEAAEEIAEAVAAAEMMLSRDGGAQEGDGEGSLEETKSAVEELLGVLEDDEVTEDEGAYLVDDDALADDVDWKKSLRTGWDDGDGGDAEGEDEGVGISWVDRAKAMAKEEAEKMECEVVDARWTNGKFLHAHILACMHARTHAHVNMNVHAHI